MDVNFAVTSPESWVVSALDARSEGIKAPGSGGAGKWATQRKPWVRAISSALVEGDESLRSRYVLWTGNQNTFGNSYDPVYFRPTFGITSMEMDFKGTMGSTRSITLNFQCWTLEDLENLEKIYMIPGMSIIIEWGWSLTSKGVRVLPNNDFLKTPSPDDNYLSNTMKSIIANRSAYDGNYDGFIGVVTNFNYSLNKDLGFDCSIEIIGPGEMFLEESAINNSGKCKDSTEGGKSKSNYEAEMNIIYKMGMDTEFIDKKNAEDQTISIIQQKWETAAREYDKKQRNWAESMYEGAFESVNPNQVREEVFISWAKFVRTINGMMGLVKATESGTATTATAPGAKGSNPKLGLDYIPITVLPKFISADPRICTFKPINMDADNGKRRQQYIEIKSLEPPEETPDEKAIKANASVKEKTLEYAGDVIESGFVQITKGIKYVDQAINEGYFSPWKTNTKLPEEGLYPQSGLPSLTDPAFAKEQILKFGDKVDIENESKNASKITSESGVGYLNNIFINAGYLRDLLEAEENLSMEDFLSKILADLNECAGGLWNLQYVVTDEDTSRLHIYDANYTSAESRNGGVKPYQFSLNKISLLDVTVESKLVDGFKEMVLYDSSATDNGTNNASTKGSKLYAASIIDGFKGKDANKSVEECSPNPNQTAKIQSDVEADLDAAYFLLIDAVDDEAVSGAKNAIKQFLTFLEEYFPATTKTLPRNNNVLLPFSFSVTIDGFSGLTWGNAINFDHFPKRYDQKIYFQITKIKHSINPDQWNTSLETVMRLRNTEVKPDSRVLKSGWPGSNIRTPLDSRTGQSLDVGAYRQTVDVYLNNPTMQIAGPISDQPLDLGPSAAGPAIPKPKSEKPNTIKFDPSNPGNASIPTYKPGNK